MSAVGSAARAPRFVRRTQLSSGEYRTNFRQIDCEVIGALVSESASRVTSQMSKIYLSLINAPAGLWERDGVLRFAGCEREGGWQTAWEQLVELTGVASATARKALDWMHKEGIIGYFAGRNGVGIRIFLNRAVSSIAYKDEKCQKNLRLVQASSGASHTSVDEVPFKDSFADLDILETDINPRAPEPRADNHTGLDKTSSTPTTGTGSRPRLNPNPDAAPTIPPTRVALEDVITRLKAELKPALHAAARQAAAREHERTREWLENRGLPKAARVAQHEAYNILKKYGIITGANRRGSAHADVGRNDFIPSPPHLLSQDEIADMAGACIAMLETRGQAIDLTLSEMSTEAGGFLLPEDAGRVREKANSLLSARDERGGK
jgi:hypothetical protein